MKIVTNKINESAPFSQLVRTSAKLDYSPLSPTLQPLKADLKFP